MIPLTESLNGKDESRAKGRTPLVGSTRDLYPSYELAAKHENLITFLRLCKKITSVQLKQFKYLRFIWLYCQKITNTS